MSATALLNPRTDLPQFQMPGERLDAWLERVTGYGRSPVERFLADFWSQWDGAFRTRKRAEVSYLAQLFGDALAPFGLDWTVDG